MFYSSKIHVYGSICQFFQYYIVVYRMFTLSPQDSFLALPDIWFSFFWFKLGQDYYRSQNFCSPLPYHPAALYFSKLSKVYCGKTTSCSSNLLSSALQWRVESGESPHWSLTFWHFVFCISLRQRDFWKPIVGRHPPPLPLPTCLSTSELSSPSCQFDSFKVLNHFSLCAYFSASRFQIHNIIMCTYMYGNIWHIEAYLAFRFCSLETIRSPLTTPTPLNITTTTIKARGMPPYVVEIYLCELTVEHANEYEADIQMSGNIYMRVKKVWCELWPDDLMNYDELGVRTHWQELFESKR